MVKKATSIIFLATIRASYECAIFFSLPCAPHSALIASTDRGISIWLQAKAIAKRYERLLLMQLNVPMGHMPRSIQQLVDAGRQD